MGRAKLRIELISNKNSRHKTFQKRMKGLKKKAYELKTLCGVDVCMIIYGPKMDGCAEEVEIWPSSPNEIMTLIDSYKKQSTEDRMKRSSDLFDYFKDQSKKVEDELAKLRKKNDEATYPTWDDRYDACTEEELRNFIVLLENKIQDVKGRVEFIKGIPRLPVAAAAGGVIIDGSQMQSIPNHYPSEQIGQMNSHYVNVPMNYPSEQQTYQGLDLGANPMLMMLMRDAQMMGGVSRSSNFLYNPQMNPTYDYCDPHMPGVMDNMVADNRQPHLARYPSNMQSIVPYMQYRMMANSSSSQVQDSQIDKYCEINGFHGMNEN